MGFRLHLIAENRRNHAYDSRHNVETAGEVMLEAAGVDRDNVERGNTLYRVTWERLIRPAIEQLGIEYAPHLHEIARQNCESFQSATQKCFRLEAVCGDALNYQLPPGPVVCF